MQSGIDFESDKRSNGRYNVREIRIWTIAHWIKDSINWIWRIGEILIQDDYGSWYKQVQVGWEFRYGCLAVKNTNGNFQREL
jgi:hypothetical protein